MNQFFFGSSAKVWDDISWIYGIEEAGFDGWEVCADGNYHFNKPDQYRLIIDTIETTSLKMSVHAPYGDLNPAAINDPIWRETLKQLKDCIRLASPLTNRVTIHPGYLSCTGKLVPEKVWQMQKETMKEIGKTATEYGVTACLENMPDNPDFLCRYPEELEGIIEGIEGVSVTIDFGHAHTLKKVNDFIRLIPMASHIHIHDNHGKSDEHLPLGEGTINWKKLSTEITANYPGVIVVEGRSIPEAKRSMNMVQGWRT